MSIECSLCNSTLRQDDIAWYACTKFSFRTSYICEICLEKIPVYYRHPTDELQQFKFSFGPLRAEVSTSSGRLQSYGSSQMKPRFWVETKVLVKTFDEGLPFFSMIYPYYDFDFYLKDIAKWHREGKYRDEQALADELRWLIILGHAIEAYLNLLDSINTEPARPLMSPYDVPKPATDPEQLRLAQELMDKVIIRFSKDD